MLRLSSTYANATLFLDTRKILLAKSVIIKAGNHCASTNWLSTFHKAVGGQPAVQCRQDDEPITLQLLPRVPRGHGLEQRLGVAGRLQVGLDGLAVHPRRLIGL